MTGSPTKAAKKKMIREAMLNAISHLPFTVTKTAKISDKYLVRITCSHSGVVSHWSPNMPDRHQLTKKQLNILRSLYSEAFSELVQTSGKSVFYPEDIAVSDFSGETH